MKLVMPSIHTLPIYFLYITLDARASNDSLDLGYSHLCADEPISDVQTPRQLDPGPSKQGGGQSYHAGHAH
jgi:hypothetical protein